ncbi:ankyrin repeat-containing domain protein [Aspergillus pseudodeflectus]|uniref:Ankyrin repeat-containing domain protein n=1 Tax=Aspergillus pseudodeflectus TaxID=176178 RepID=A0ABR4K9S9_9EURO
MTQLLNLPFEIIRLIVECLQSKHDINALIQTCRFLYDAFDSHLYEYDMRYASRSALRWAARHGHDSVVAKSLAAGPYVEFTGLLNGATPLLLATRYGHAGIVKRLLLLVDRIDLEAWDTWSGRTALAEAAASGQAEIAKLLLEKGANVQTKDRDSCSPLLLAVENGHYEVVRMLLDHGAPVNTRHKHYQTPLSQAAERGRLKCVDLLLQYGAMVDSQDGYGRTELFHAAKNSYDAVVKRLLEAGADPNKRASRVNGWTPLHQAACNSNVSVIRLLLGAGADPRATDEQGHIPAHLVDSNGSAGFSPSESDVVRDLLVKAAVGDMLPDAVSKGLIEEIL